MIIRTEPAVKQKASQLLMILLLWGAVSAHAQVTITQTRNYTGTPNYTRNLSFDQFNPALGHLTGIRVQVSMNTNGGFLSADNDGASAATASVRLGANGGIRSDEVNLLNASFGSIGANMSVSTGSDLSLAADNGDGPNNVDPTAPDGAVHTGGADSQSVDDNVTSAVFETPGKSYVGTGNYTVIVDANALIDFGGLGGVEGGFGPPTVDGQVTITYTYTPYAADLGILKTVDNATPALGATIVYTLTASNAGPDPASNVVVNDLLPTGIDFVSASGAGSYNASTGVWTVGDLANGASVQLQITATVGGTGLITNTATITSDVPDPNPGNNTSSTGTTTPARIDLELSKSASTLTPNYKSNVTFSLTVRNTSTYDNATGVTVTDLLPAGLTYVSHSGGTYNASTGVWTVGTVARNNGAATLQITARVDQVGSITNTASVTTANQTDVDSTPGSGSGEDDDDSVTLTVPQAADLRLVKTVDQASRTLGQQAVYTLTVYNDGPNAATGVTVRDVLPAGMNFVSTSGAYSNATGLWTVGSLASGASASITITATVTATGALANTAQVWTSDVHDPDSTPGSGSNEDDDDSVTVTVPARVDLELSKTVSSATPRYGDNVTYTLTVRNASTYDNATGVTVTDLLPAGLTHVSHSGGTYNASTGVWTVGTVSKNNGSATLQITARVNATGSIENFTQVSACNESDVDSTPGDGDQGDDDDAKVSITVAPAADLRLDKAASKSNPSLMENVTFTLTLTNDGPDAATGVTVTDLLPAGLTFVSSTGGDYNSGTGLWNVGGLASGASATLQITVQVGQTGPIVNTAQVGTANEYDPDSTPGSGTGEDDDDSVQLDVPRTVDLRLEKTVSNATPDYRSNVTYTLTLTNDGPDPASGIVVSDPLPAGLSLVSDNGGGAYNGGTGLWTVGSLASGASASLALTVQLVSTGTITNTAQVSACDDDDTDSTPGNSIASEDDQDDAVVTVAPAADLRLQKTVNNSMANLGQNVAFTVTLVNDGPDAATAITVQDLLPAGLSMQSATPSQGSYDNGTGLWTVGGLNASASATLQITAWVTATGVKTNTAQVASCDLYDPDSTPNNNEADEDDQDSATVTTASAADVRLQKSVSNATPAFGANVAYTLTVTNEGPDAATGLTVQDLLPASMTYVTHSGGTYSSATGLWSIGTLNASASASLEITARVNGTGSIVNTAQVSAMNEYDADSTPNNNDPAEDDQDTAIITVAPAVDLSLDKSASPMDPGNGETTVFTLRVTNSSPHDDATGVVVRDNLVAGLRYVSSTGDGSYDPDTGLWTVGAVAKSGGTRSIALTVRVDQAGSLANFAEVQSCDQWDMDSTPGNGAQGEDDEDQVTLGVLEVADLSLIKTVDQATPGLGETVVYTLTLSNAGPDAGSNIEVQDAFPAGLAYVSHGGGSYDNGSGRWTVASLPVGQSAVLQITATVQGTGAIVNTAQVGGADQRDPDSTPGNSIASEDDQDSAAITVPPSVDLSLSKTVDSETVGYLGQATFTLTVANASSHDDATGVTVTDLLPEGLRFVSASGDGSYDADTGLWTVGTVAKSGGSRTLQMVVQATRTGGATNVAEISACNERDVDSTPGNGETSEDDQDAASVTVPLAADLSLSKWSNNPGAGLGDTLIFTLRVANAGPDAATGVRVHDKLPDAFEYLSHDGYGSYDPSWGSWDVGNVGVGQRVAIQIRTLVRSTGHNVNVAEIDRADQYDPDSTPDNHVDGEDDQAYGSVNGPASVDLELDKTVDASAPNYQDEVVFTLTLRNVSPHDDATGVTVRDALPTGLRFVSALGDGGYDAASGLWRAGSLAKNGGTAMLAIRARVEATGTLTNFAQVTACDQGDLDSTPDNGPSGEDDEDAVTLTVAPSADLSLVKTVDDATPFVLQPVRYTLTLANAGPDSALGVVVTDKLPAGLVFMADSGDGSYDAVTGLWTVGALAAGQALRHVIDATLTADLDPIVNTAEVTASVRHDHDSTPGNGQADEDDQSRVTVTPVPHIDLSLQKHASSATLGLGQTTVFTLIIHNAGPNAATGVSVKDLLPQGLVYRGHAGGGYSATSGLWTLGSLAVGATDTLRITATARQQGEIINTAEVQSADQADVDSTPGNDADEDDRAQAGVTVSAAGIGDRLWMDLDGDGLQGPGEPGLSGVTLRLSQGGEALASAVTDTSGFYLFANLSAGAYTVTVDAATVPAGLALTTGNLPWTATLQAGGARLDADFGYKPSGGSIGDEVWMDADGNGQRESTETQGLSGITLFLKDTAGRLLASTVTDTLGHYLFTHLDPAEYRVEIDVTTLQPGLSLTTPATHVVTLALDQSHLDADFGCRALEGNVGSIGNLIWIDTDRDGVQDADERQGIAGIEVVLMDAGGNELARDVTDSDGNYLFNFLPAGGYWVDVNGHDADMPEGYVLTTDNEPYFVQLAAGQDDSQADFGYMDPDAGVAVLGDYTWHDANWNRHQDGDESSLSWIEVRLFQGGQMVASQKTDLWGYYQFANLEPGTYLVKALQVGPMPPQGQSVGKTAPHEPWRMTTVDSFWVTLAAGDRYAQADFGFAYPSQNWGAGDEKVLARYQPWYAGADADSAGRHWSYGYAGGYADSSLVGEYDACDADVIDYQILSAWAAGIDGFVVDWRGRDAYENRPTHLLLDRAQALNQRYGMSGMNFQVAVSYHEKALGKLDDNFRYIADSLMSHPAYWGSLEHLRQPLFFFDESENLIGAGEYRACADTLLPQGSLLLWNQADTTVFGAVNGVYPWVQPHENQWQDDGLRWGGDHLDWSYETANTASSASRLAFVIGGVWPGLDDHAWSQGQNHYIDRQDTAVYQWTWDRVHDYRESGQWGLPMPWCLVETWNNFNGATQIEPTVGAGYQFSRMTRENARRFKSSQDAQHVGVDNLGLVVPKHLHQARMAARLRPADAAGITALCDQARRCLFCS